MANWGIKQVNEDVKGLIRMLSGVNEEVKSS